MKRIFIVEDDPAIRELLEMNLTVAGYACESAADGAEALQKITVQSYDLALLDIMLPETDGFELMPYMQRADIPVIYLSAKSDEADRVRGLRLGAEDYLVKPFGVLELLVRIEKVLKRRDPGEDIIECCGVRVFKIEGRARSADYVKRCAGCYRRAADAVCDGSFTPELAASLKASLSEVFNRGFWDGYYQGARLGEWSRVYGSQATRRKVYCGRISNWFDRIGVAEISVEATELRVGDEIMVIGATSGVAELTVSDMRLDLQPCSLAPKGSRCSVAMPSGPDHVRRGDKVYLWVESSCNPL